MDLKEIIINAIREATENEYGYKCIKALRKATNRNRVYDLLEEYRDRKRNTARRNKAKRNYAHIKADREELLCE